jgi:hypothetical protein
MTWSLTPSRAEAGFWLILTAGLAAGVGLETDWGRQPELPLPKTAGTPPVFAKPVLAEPFQLGGPDQFPDITSRPLFIITRLPAPVAPTADSKPSMKKDQFILLGTTIVGADKFAFLLEKAGNRSRVVGVGKEINGITVKEVAADRVVLSQHDDTEVLLLKMNKPAPGAITPIAPPIPAPRPAMAPAVTPPQPPPPAQPQAPRQPPTPAAGPMVGPR